MGDHFFEPGMLERKDNGEVVIHDKVLEECCRPEDRCMPGADSNIYYVGPVRNLTPQRWNKKLLDHSPPSDDLVVKFQGITPSTVVGDLVECYKIAHGNVRLNITHLKYAETKFDLDTLVHDMIKKPGELGLTKFYFTYVEHNTNKMDIDDLVGFIEGEDKTPAKADGKKKKKPKKKSKAETTTARQSNTPEERRVHSPESKHSSPDVDLSSVQLNVATAPAMLEVQALTAMENIEDLSMLGAHGGDPQETAHMNVNGTKSSSSLTTSESREPLPGDARRREDRKKIIRELAIVRETATTMEERLKREQKLDEGEEPLEGAENTGEPPKEDVKENGPGQEQKEKKPKERKKEEAVQKSSRDKKVEEMQQVLECKERQAEELRQSVQRMIEEKSKEMTALISAAEQIEDSQALRRKRISKIDAAIKDLATEMERMNNEKRETVQECDAAEANTKITKLGKEIDSLQRMLREPEGEASSEPVEAAEVMTKANPELLQFMERQIEAVEKELECPICLEVASQAPIYKCEEDLLICSKCRVKVRVCPQCREEYPEGPHKRYRGAERQAERLAGMYKERDALLHHR